jgi:hypothetical protein
MGALLDRPNTTKLLQDGELLLPARAADALGYKNDSGNGSETQLPAYWLVKFGGASMQGWRKYQSVSHIHPRPARCASLNLRVPHPSSVILHICAACLSGRIV